MKKLLRFLSYALPILILLFMAFGFLFEPNSPTKTDILNKFQASSAQHPFGTDDLGRCVFSRMLEGGKVTLGIVLLGGAIVLVLGIPLGMVFSRTKGGSGALSVLSDSILNAVTAIPPIAYLIILIGIWGNSIPTMVVALTVSLILRMIKLVMALVEGEYSKAYVKCAIACGAGRLRVMTVHILPVILRDVTQFICLSCSDMILAISGFSFIGLTLGADVIDWGTLLSGARKLSSIRPALLWWPIIFIFVCSLCFNFLGRKLQRRDG